MQPFLVRTIRLFLLFWQWLITTLPQLKLEREVLLVSEFKWPMLCWFMHHKYTWQVQATGLKCNNTKKMYKYIKIKISMSKEWTTVSWEISVGSRKGTIWIMYSGNNWLTLLYGKLIFQQLLIYWLFLYFL